MCARSRPGKLAICVTFHFSPERLVYLHDIASHFASLGDMVEVNIVTNQAQKCPDILGSLNDLDLDIRLVVPDHLEHPYYLTWCHLDVFRRIVEEDAATTHFLYLEDDIRVTRDNMHWWMEGRERLRPSGAIPSFLRFEISAADGCAYSTDALYAVDPRKIPKVLLLEHRYAYLNLPQPYQGMYLLDRELALEYFSAPLPSVEDSIWGVRETAAGGVTFLNVPEGFTSRNLVGYRLDESRIDPECLIHHIPNNYADDPHTAFGKVRIADLVAPPLDGESALAEYPGPRTATSPMWPWLRSVLRRAGGD
jgi:hypothetical protein